MNARISSLLAAAALAFAPFVAACSGESPTGSKAGGP